MSLDIWVGDWSKAGSKLITSFDPEAYYIYLYPLFEEFEQTSGQFIDQYDGAIFEPSELDQVTTLIGQAESLVLQEDEEFVVHMGTCLGSALEPMHEEIYETVNRKDFLKFINEWKSAVAMASKLQKPLIFYGD